MNISPALLFLGLYGAVLGLWRRSGCFGWVSGGVSGAFHVEHSRNDLGGGSGAALELVFPAFIPAGSRFGSGWVSVSSPWFRVSLREGLGLGVVSGAFRVGLVRVGFGCGSGAVQGGPATAGPGLSVGVVFTG